MSLDRLPFDYKSPLGFLLAIAIQYTMLVYALLFGSCVVALGIGFFLYEMAASKCIKTTLFSINRNIHAETDAAQIMEQLIEFLQFDSQHEQLSVSKA